MGRKCVEMGKMVGTCGWVGERLEIEREREREKRYLLKQIKT